MRILCRKFKEVRDFKRFFKSLHIGLFSGNTISDPNLATVFGKTTDTMPWVLPTWRGWRLAWDRPQHSPGGQSCDPSRAHWEEHGDQGGGRWAAGRQTWVLAILLSRCRSVPFHLVCFTYIHFPNSARISSAHVIALGWMMREPWGLELLTPRPVTPESIVYHEQEAQRNTKVIK